VAKIDTAMGGRAAEEIVFGKDKVMYLPWFDLLAGHYYVANGRI